MDNVGMVLILIRPRRAPFVTSWRIQDSISQRSGARALHTRKNEGLDHREMRIRGHDAGSFLDFCLLFPKRRPFQP